MLVDSLWEEEESVAQTHRLTPAPCLETQSIQTLEFHEFLYIQD